MIRVLTPFLDTFTYTVSNGLGETASATVTIDVTDNAPVVLPDGPFAVVQGQTVAVSPAGGVLANAADPDGDPLTVSAVNGDDTAVGQAVSTSQGGTITVNADGSWSYTAPSSYTGPDSVTFTVSDGLGGTASATLTFEVTAGDETYAVVHGQTLIAGAAAGVLTDPSLTVTAVNGDSSAVGQPITTAEGGTLTLNSDGSFSYTAPMNFMGTDSFTFDTSNGTLGTVVTINVTDQAPVVADAEYTAEHDQPLADNTYGVLYLDSDPDGDMLTVSSYTQPANGILSMNSNGTFVYTPAAHFVGEDSFTYVASDGLLSSTPVTVTIDVIDQSAPDAEGTSYDVEAGQVLTVAAPGLTEDVSDADGDALSLVVVSGPQNGQLTSFGGDGSFVYQANAGFAGSDSFTFEAYDGVEYSAPATVTITVLNNPPIAVPDEYYVATNGSLTPDQTGVLNNDVDMGSTPLTAVLVSGPSHAASFAFNVDGAFSYTPTTDYVGDDSITYEAFDGTTYSAPVQVTLHVVDKPVALPDYYFVNGLSTLVVNAAQGLLSNDLDLQDPSAPMSAVILSGPNPNEGTLVPNNVAPDGTFDGSFSFMPSVNFSGQATFTYGLVIGGVVQAQTTATLVGLVMGQAVKLYTTTYQHNLGVAQAVIGLDPNPVRSDSTGQAYDQEQWKDDNGDGVATGPNEHAYPIRYSAGEVIYQTAIFKVDPSAYNLLYFYLYAPNPANRLSVQGNEAVNLLAPNVAPHAALLNSTNIRMWMQNGQGFLGIYNAQANAALPNHAGAGWLATFWDLTLTAIPNAPQWYPIGGSVNPLFVTFTRPRPGVQEYFTPLSIGTNAAALTNNVTGIVSNAWAAFAGPANLMQVAAFGSLQNTPLAYYGSWSVSPDDQTVPGLLRDHTGSCAAFAWLFAQTLADQGLSGITIPNGPAANIANNAGVVEIQAGQVQAMANRWQPQKEWMLINNWQFPANPEAAFNAGGRFGPYNYYNILSLGDSMLPPVLTPLATSMTANQYLWGGGGAGYAQVTDQPGTSGQNQLNPPSLFGNHFVVRIGNTYYDPSYGLSFSVSPLNLQQGLLYDPYGLRALQNAEVAGFAIQSSPQRETGMNSLNYDINHDGVPQPNTTTYNLLLIRRVNAGAPVQITFAAPPRGF